MLWIFALLYVYQPYLNFNAFVCRQLPGRFLFKIGLHLICVILLITKYSEYTIMCNTHPWSVGDSMYHPDTVTIILCDQFGNLFININMLHVRKLTDISFLCTRTKYNNLSFLENHSCVKITHATFIILKSFSVQYFSQKSWASVIYSVWQCLLFLLTWRFLLESK